MAGARGQATCLPTFRRDLSHGKVDAGNSQQLLADAQPWCLLYQVLELHLEFSFL